MKRRWFVILGLLVGCAGLVWLFFPLEIVGPPRWKPRSAEALAAGWNPPLMPPGAENISVGDWEPAPLGGMKREIRFDVPMSRKAIKAFYETELVKRGWKPCPSNTLGKECSKCSCWVSDIEYQDVYRRIDDLTRTGPTIEILAPIPFGRGRSGLMSIENIQQSVMFWEFD